MINKIQVVYSHVLVSAAQDSAKEVTFIPSLDFLNKVSNLSYWDI